MFDLEITIPNEVQNFDNSALGTYQITSERQKDHIYMAIHYASEYISLAHGLDFHISPGAQPLYASRFAEQVQYYLNNLALQGIFRSYENRTGKVPGMGARASKNIKHIATPVSPRYSSSSSGKNC